MWPALLLSSLPGGRDSQVSGMRIVYAPQDQVRHCAAEMPQQTSSVQSESYIARALCSYLFISQTMVR